MKYKVIYDYHTHTVFSHGKGTIEDNAAVARARGLSGIAITDHGPGHLLYGMDPKRISEMRRIVEEENRKDPGLTVYLSVEANICEKGNCVDISPELAGQFDFLIAGYHYGVRHGFCLGNFLGNKRLLVKNTEMTVRAVYENDIRILTHPGDKGAFDIAEIAKACAARGTLMEISAHHDHLTVEEIRISAKTDAKFVVSSDAHRPERVGDVSQAVERAMSAGLCMERIVNIAEIKGEEAACRL